MILIFIGLILWIGLHFMPATKPRIRSWLIKRRGPNAYMSIFALGLVAAIVMMVMGWRGAEQWTVYNLPAWSSIAGNAFVIIGVILFGFGFDKNMKTNLKRFVRHLQLTGMVYWSTGHLLLNGDNRSVLLFGGLALWALAMMVFINRRDGPWIKPQKVPLGKEFVPTIIALAFIVSFVFGHSYLSGIALLSRP